MYPEVQDSLDDVELAEAGGVTTVAEVLVEVPLEDVLVEVPFDDVLVDDPLEEVLVEVLEAVELVEPLEDVLVEVPCDEVLVMARPVVDAAAGPEGVVGVVGVEITGGEAPTWRKAAS